MKHSVSQNSQRYRAIRLSLAALVAVAIAVVALALSATQITSGTHPGTRPAVQAPAVNEPILSGECLKAQPVEGPTC